MCDNVWPGLTTLHATTAHTGELVFVECKLKYASEYKMLAKLVLATNSVAWTSKIVFVVGPLSSPIF
jgi:hypothetical protein